MHILASVDSTLLDRFHSLFGLAAFLFIAFLIGRLRGAKSIPWRIILWGIGLQFAFALLVIYTPGFLTATQARIQNLLDFTLVGARLVFGNLASTDAPVYDASGNALGQVTRVGSFVAFVVLPTILFVSTLTAVLYHTGILSLVVHGLAWVMHKTTGCSGAEALSTAANIFVGQTEAPLFIRPFMAAATRSELTAIMIGGFANIATGVLIVYANALQNFIPNIGGHLAAACFISAPATLVIAKLLCPETQTPQTSGGISFKIERTDANLIDAATRGTTEGMHLALNVGAMLIAFTALVALLNALYGYSFSLIGIPSASFDQHLGYVMIPFAWLLGIPWQDTHVVGQLLAKKTAFNEYLAYLDFAALLTANPDTLSPRSRLITAYALCGFANFASIGIQVGGISVLAPTRRAELSQIALPAMIGGFIATCTGACVIGIIY